MGKTIAVPNQKDGAGPALAKLRRLCARTVRWADKHDVVLHGG